jgi:FkbM family methyltransferase
MYGEAGVLVRNLGMLSSVLGGSTRLKVALHNRFLQEYKDKPILSKQTKGFEICLEPKDLHDAAYIYNTGTYERSTTDLFSFLAKKSQVVFDVGAYWGWFTLLGAAILRNGGRVFSFEPSPSNFSMLKRSIQLNGFSNATLFEEAISNTDSDCALYEGGNPYKHSLVRDFGLGSVSVKSSRLDTVAESLSVNRIDMLKMDVEGNEPQVFLGAQSLLQNERIGNIIMEYSPKSWSGYDALLDALFHSFDVYHILDSPKPFTISPAKRNKLGENRHNLYLQLRS